jgi:hypothetical protein
VCSPSTRVHRARPQLCTQAGPSSAIVMPRPVFIFLLSQRKVSVFALACLMPAVGKFCKALITRSVCIFILNSKPFSLRTFLAPAECLMPAVQPRLRCCLVVETRCRSKTRRWWQRSRFRLCGVCLNWQFFNLLIRSIRTWKTSQHSKHASPYTQTCKFAPA